MLADRLSVWSERLQRADPRARTILAEHRGVIGFAHVVCEDDPEWGALLDNLHVAHGHMRRGIGRRLLRLTAAAVLERPHGSGLYVWVLEQNVDAQAFYEACGATLAGREPVAPPGGVASRLSGAPAKLRYAWPDARALCQ